MICVEENVWAKLYMRNSLAKMYRVLHMWIYTLAYAQGELGVLHFPQLTSETEHWRQNGFDAEVRFYYTEVHTDLSGKNTNRLLFSLHIKITSLSLHLIGNGIICRLITDKVWTESVVVSLVLISLVVICLIPSELTEFRTLESSFSLFTALESIPWSARPGNSPGLSLKLMLNFLQYYIF